jgi:hypothetical protein
MQELQEMYTFDARDGLTRSTARSGGTREDHGRHDQLKRERQMQASRLPLRACTRADLLVRACEPHAARSAMVSAARAPCGQSSSPLVVSIGGAGFGRITFSFWVLSSRPDAPRRVQLRLPVFGFSRSCLSARSSACPVSSHAWHARPSARSPCCIFSPQPAPSRRPRQSRIVQVTVRPARALRPLHRSKISGATCAGAAAARACLRRCRCQPQIRPKRSNTINTTTTSPIPPLG